MSIDRSLAGRAIGVVAAALALTSLDLTWPAYGAVGVACAVLLVLSGGLEAAVLSGWCGAALGALVVLVAEVAIGGSLSPVIRLCVVGVSVSIATAVLRSAGLYACVRRHVTTADRSVVGLALAWIVVWAPRSGLDAMGFLYPEDNQKWMMSVAAELRGTNESIAVPLGSVNVQYFIRFVLGTLTIPTHLGRHADDVASLSLRVQANGWMLSLATILILTPVLVRLGLRLLATELRGLIATVAAVLGAIFSFGQAQSVGHYTQFQLTAVVFVGMVLVMFVASGDVGPRPVLVSLVSVPIALAIGGSYNPWLPVGLVCAAALVVAVHRDAVVRVLRSVAGLVAATLGAIAALVISVRTFSRFARDLDMEGGVSTVHVEALLVCAASAAGFIFVYVVGRWRMRSAPGSDPAGDASTALTADSWWADAGRVCFSLAPLIAFLLGADESAIVAISAVSLLSLALDRTARWIRLPAVQPRRWSSALPLVGSVPIAAVIWAVTIWLASRYASEVRAPRFAAWKSIVALIGQFGWIATAATLATRWSTRRLVRWTVVFGATVALFSTFGYQQRAGEIYVQPKWWHEPVLGELRRDSAALVVCVSGEVGWPDYETYTCNRYLQTLGEHSDINGIFRYVAWYRTEKIEQARDALVAMRPASITVVSPGVVGESWHEYFSSMDIPNVRYLEGRS